MKQAWHFLFRLRLPFCVSFQQLSRCCLWSGQTEDGMIYLPRSLAYGALSAQWSTGHYVLMAHITACWWNEWWSLITVLKGRIIHMWEGAYTSSWRRCYQKPNSPNAFLIYINGLPNYCFSYTFFSLWKAKLNLTRPTVILCAYYILILIVFAWFCMISFLSASIILLLLLFWVFFFWFLCFSCLLVKWG